MRLILLILVLLFSLVPPAGAQTTQPAAGERLRVYLMTVGPGQAVYERFGHNQIWIHDPGAGSDIAYNYGVFDFEQENFVWRFIQGRMLYRCEPVEARDIAAWYRRNNPDRSFNLSAEQWLAIDYIAAQRSVWVQELNLSARQKHELQQFLQWNATPPNNEYRYDYYADNCSTRVRDALDRVLGGRIGEQSQGIATDTTYRWHTRRLTRPDLMLYTGLYAVLGQPVDQPIDQWEEMFLPVKLMEHLRGVTTIDDTGATVPLVRREWQLHDSQAFVAPDAPPQRWWVWYGLTGIMLGTLLAGMGRMARGGHKIARRVMGLGIAAWGLVAGVAGVIGTWAWFTDHSAAHWNENWLQLNPISLVLVVAGVMMAFRARRRGKDIPSPGTPGEGQGGGSSRSRGAGPLPSPPPGVPGEGEIAWWTAAIALALSVLGAVLQVLPQFDQVNGETIWLALPLHAGVFLAIHVRLGGREPVPSKDLPGRKLA